MESKYNKSLLSRLSNFERNHNEWEWSDLISWLQSVKKLVQKHKDEELYKETLITVSKRLTQCLNPTLPPGLHSKTLEIYGKLLSLSKIADFHWFSSGLLPFCQHCSSQNKAQFLQLISEVYLPHIRDIEHILPGLIASLLSGAEDRPETFTKMKELLENFSVERKELVQTGVWNVILNTQQFKGVGLKYIQTCLDVTLHQDLAIRSLLRCLDDDQPVLVKRQALDVIKSHFPMKNELISKESKMRLMYGVLKLLKYQDLTLLRRF